LYHVAQHDHWNAGTYLSVYGSAALFALIARSFWKDRKSLLQLGEAANGSIDKGR